MPKNTAVNINDERDVRLHKMKELEEQGINAYPARVNRTHTLQEALDAAEGEEMTVTGRIMTKRDMGKLTFAHLQDGTARMQIALRKDELDTDAYKQFLKKIDGGDIIEVTGERFVTHKGEPSVLVKSYRLLAKALLPLPDKFHGLSDEETRYRKRYLDFLVNPEQKEKIIVRSKILKYMREYLDNQGFIEVETPTLEVVASGAMAQTFDTHLNAFDLPVHLRICIGELWQKRLLVGGFEKIYEIGRAFRNEGVDHSHNPEFTMMEFYWAYADINDNIKLHEEMMPYIVEKSIGKLKVESDGHTIDFTAPYPRITFRDAVLEHSGIDINKCETTEKLAKAMAKKGYEVEEGAERGKLLDNLYKQSARPAIIQPTFVLNYPVELKPLAKKSEDPRYTEMFQLVVKGFELVNAYTELNDPIDQRERFEEQARLGAAGEEEVMGYDRDYVEALEYAMPPATGTGTGIDRFAALITDSHTIREVTTFPMMKPEGLQLSGKARNTMIAQVVVLNDPKREAWTALNAIAHLTAALGAREGKKLFQFETNTTKDGQTIPMNIQHAIMIKQTADVQDLRDLKKQAEDAGMHIECFTQPMQDTTDDAKVQAMHQKTNSKDLPLLGVLVYGPKKAADTLTKSFDLWSGAAGSNGAPQAASSGNANTRTAADLPMSRDEAWELILKYNTEKADLHHYRESEVVMRALAKHLGRDVEYWGMLGMLHDIDWGMTKDEPKTHLTKMPALLREAGFSEQFIEDVLSHGYGCECADLMDMSRDCEIQYALACGETVTGLVQAAARLRPEKIATLKVSSLKKKFKNKKFAAKVDRDVILECEKLGIELDAFLELAIEAIKEIADEVDLA